VPTLGGQVAWETVEGHHKLRFSQNKKGESITVSVRFLLLPSTRTRSSLAITSVLRIRVLHFSALVISELEASTYIQF
jgi:hypothetical protein